MPLSCLSQGISLLVKQSSAQFLGQSRNLDISVFVPGPRCPVLFDIHHSCPASLMSFTFRYEPGEGSAVCFLNKLEYANNTVRTELPFNLLSAEHSPFQGDLFLCGCIKGFWSKAVGKVEESRFFFHVSPWHRPRASLPGCFVLQTEPKETETGYILLWPPFESQITKYRLGQEGDVRAFQLITSSKQDRNACIFVF